MSELEDALGGIGGLLVGGIFLLIISDALNPLVEFNLTLLGIGFILVALFLGVLLVVSVITTILDGL